MLARKIALLDLSGQVPMPYLEKVASALELQVVNDFSEIWDITASVLAVASIADVPKGYWPVYVKETIDLANAYGYHWVSETGIPYAEILYRENWSITASHELLEMLVNPFLDKYQVTDISAEFEGDEKFLLEVAGPVQNIKYGYFIDNVLVSNFFYPSYFDLLVVTGKKYDHLGIITKPRSILEGGYVSFIDNLGQWWQAFKIQNRVDLRRLGGSSEEISKSSGRIFRLVLFFAASLITSFFVYKFFKKKLNH